jgi:hypothetical protein
VSAGFLIQANGLANRLELAFGKACLVALVTYPPTVVVGLVVLALLAILDGGRTGKADGRCACCSSTTRSPCGACCE